MADGDPRQAENGTLGQNNGNNNDMALLDLINKTGYQIVQENGQRKYGGPPPGWDENVSPPKGSEIFVGKLPRDCFEPELVPIFERIGKIYEMRLMMDFSGSNRGYAFIMFTNPQDAKRAIQELNNYEIRRGKYLGVVKSIDNCRLFVGGIPRTKSKEEIFEEMRRITDGVVDVILYRAVADKSKSRGFAFVEYDSHKAAAMARRRLLPGKIQLWGQEIAVDWAEPEPEVDPDTMSKVKVLYIRNLMLNTSEDTLRDLCCQIREGSVEKVKKLRDYAFVHFSRRDDAQAVLEALHDTELEGSIIEVTWAKPVDRLMRGLSRRSPSPMGNGYDAGAGDYGPYVLASPAYYGAPGHLYPVVSYAGNFRGRGRGAAGVRTTGYMGRGYARRPLEHQLYEENGMELVSSNPVQVLNDYCQRHNLGDPTYQPILQHMYRDPHNRTLPFYGCKVTIPGLGQAFQPLKLAPNMEDAKNFAAENVLFQVLGNGHMDPVRDVGSPSPPPSPFEERTEWSNGHPNSPEDSQYNQQPCHVSLEDALNNLKMNSTGHVIQGMVSFCCFLACVYHWGRIAGRCSCDVTTLS